MVAVTIYEAGQGGPMICIEMDVNSHEWKALGRLCCLSLAMFGGGLGGRHNKAAPTSTSTICYKEIGAYLSRGRTLI